jgi:Dullard-like phosphatase family protein
MKRNITNYNTNKKKINEKQISKSLNNINLNNTTKTTLLKNSSSLEILKRTSTNINLINIDSDALSTFNIESLIEIESAICHFCNPKISPEPSSFLDYYKTIRYYMLNVSLKRIFQKNNTKFLEILEKMQNLNFLSILIERLLLPSYKDNSRLKNTIINCISLTYQNFLLLCQIIISQLNKYSYTNIFLNKLRQITLKKSIMKTNFKTKGFINEIDRRNKEILEHLKIILNINKKMTQLKKGLSPLSLVMKAIDKLSTNWTIDYCLKVLGENDASLKEIKESTYLDLEDNVAPLYLPIKVPFLNDIDENSYVLTVVLDLDETLIRYTNDNLIKRPYLDDFLSRLVKAKCELIIFTASTREYADPLIDQIEGDKKYFNQRLYRQHTVLIDDNFVKDLTKLGRDLSRIIIVDNEQYSFCLQKKNGILIKPFFAENEGFNLDMTLDNLSIILLKIIKNSFVDIRKELELYKDEIENKVTKDI